MDLSIFNIFNIKNNDTVITFGTFDLFHQGHYNILKRASTYGKKLIVGVSSDWLNLIKKGIETVQNQDQRIKKIKSLDFVDTVFLEESLEKKKNILNFIRLIFW